MNDSFLPYANVFLERLYERRTFYNRDIHKAYRLYGHEYGAVDRAYEQKLVYTNGMDKVGSLSSIPSVVVVVMWGDVVLLEGSL